MKDFFLLLVALLTEQLFCPKNGEYFNIPKNKRVIQQELFKSMKDALALSRSHASVDTAAKKLYVRREYEKLDRLKFTLSAFIEYEQLNKKPDPRYDVFFASLIGNNVRDFPSDVIIMSWNYDSQFELAFTEFSGDKRLNSSKAYLNIITKFDLPARIDDGFGIYKLNGNAGIFQRPHSQQYSFVNDMSECLDKKIMENIVRHYAALVYHNMQFYNSLSFAWEEQDSEKSIVNKVKEHTKDCEALVIIGYSFPFFNRPIDRKIIGSMVNLKTVYFQSPEADALIDRFRSIRPDLPKNTLHPIHDTEQFFLPPEL